MPCAAGVAVAAAAAFAAASSGADFTTPLKPAGGGGGGAGPDLALKLEAMGEERATVVCLGGATRPGAGGGGGSGCSGLSDISPRLGPSLGPTRHRRLQDHGVTRVNTALISCYTHTLSLSLSLSCYLKHKPRWYFPLGWLNTLQTETSCGQGHLSTTSCTLPPTGLDLSRAGQGNCLGRHSATSLTLRGPKPKP